MLTGPKRIVRNILLALLQAFSVILYLAKVPYWGVVKTIITYWGKRGLHSITVGQFSGGATKTRSLYREDILLKAILLFVNVRGKSCLDLACNDGFWSFRLARFGLKSVTGIDLDEEAVRKANFLKLVYDFPGFQFTRCEIFEFLADNQPKSYDIILLLSILYHLPEETDWPGFFGTLARINNEALIIDSRWFEDDAYWYDKSSGQAIIKTEAGIIKKWRPLRKELFDYLHQAGYEEVVEINPAIFLTNSPEAFGNGDPYTLENVSDYITGNRTLLIAYKKKTTIPTIVGRLTVEDTELAQK